MQFIKAHIHPMSTMTSLPNAVFETVPTPEGLTATLSGLSGKV